MPFLRLRTSPLSWLLIAGAFHVLVALTIFLVGHFQLLPNTFDTHGIGLTFSIDSFTYQELATNLADTLRNSGLSAWVTAPAPFHCRLYSLSFAVLGKLLGYNILAAEPLNLLYYLGVLSFVYLLGREIFNPRAAWIAASIVALWPSLLLHSVQLIRDPLSIFCLLGLVFVATLLISRELSWKESVGSGICGASFVAAFWLARANMWNVAIVTLALTLLLLAIRIVREKKLMAGNLLVVFFLIAVALLIPSRIESTTLPGMYPPRSAFTFPSAAQSNSSPGLWTRLITQITRRRDRFQHGYLLTGSNIDTQVRLNNAGDILKYLPRATVIGLFAPFPNMWVQRAGPAGAAARILSGLETSVMYFLYALAGVCLWREWRRLRMWLMLLVAFTGIVSLGLVVVNVGALYRLRYAFWIMLIIIATQGSLIVVKRIGERGKSGIRA